jgi:hypothetical protein
MNYSQVSLTNLALNRIGARGAITSINDSNPNAVKALMCWDVVFQEVLSERDWKFAKTRADLQLSTTTPLYAYRHAWSLPADFLRFVRPHKRPPDRNYAWFWGPEGFGFYHREDPPFWPPGHVYVVETLPTDGNRYVLTNFGGCNGTVSAKINYIRLITDYTQLMPGFVNCFVNRLAMELAIGVTEDKQKKDDLRADYKDSLNSAEAQNECLDYEQDEAGSTSWQDAGRFVRGW